jgi:adenylate kinase family enzyme
MKLHLFGASGTGVSTLGEALAAALGVPYFDTDDYFWEATNPPFTARCPPAVRDARLAHDLAPHQSWLVGGSLVGWDENWLTAFDLVVFLYLPPALRLQRLLQREHARYGPAIAADPGQAARTQAFLDWAAGYDDGSSGGSRTLANHTRWLTQFSSPVLELRGDLTVAERVAAVRAELRRWHLFA